MSSGVVVRGAPTVVANGTYYISNEEVTGTARVWISADKCTCIKYFSDDSYRYTLTTDVTVSNTKKYYIKNDDGTFAEVVDPIFNSQIYSGRYYERVPYSGWEIREIKIDAAGSMVEQDSLFWTPDESGILSPYDDGLVWYDFSDVVASDLKITFWDESAFVTSTSTSEPDENGTVTVVTTMTNIITGDVYRETNVVMTKVKYESTPLIRYDNVNLVLGKVYKFRFVSDFKQLGYDPDDDTQSLSAGVYRVEKIMNYIDMVSNGIDLYANLYQPCKVPKEVYLADVDRISDSAIYRLVDPTDESRVFFMPQIFVFDTPDPSVDECFHKQLVIDLGVHGDEYVHREEYVYYDEEGNVIDPKDAVQDRDSSAVNTTVQIVKKRIRLIDDLTEFVSQVLEKKWGISVDLSDISDDTKVVRVEDVGSSWLTPMQQSVLEAERIKLSENSKVDFETLFNLDKNNIYYKENLRLRGRIKALEELVQSQSNKINTLTNNE